MDKNISTAVSYLKRRYIGYEIDVRETPGEKGVLAVISLTHQEDPKLTNWKVELRKTRLGTILVFRTKKDSE